MPPSAGVVTYLFTDIEGSTRLWEQQPESMRLALARHDAIAKEAVRFHNGTVVKTTGDGIHAAFNDPSDALAVAIELQRAFADPETTAGVALKLRCGMHAGIDERRDNDFFGQAVNRAARVMSVAHGGQVLLSEAVAALVREDLPAGVTLRDLGIARLRDLTHSERIYQAIHPDLRRDFPALRSLEATPNNLPHQLTSFIGREREQTEVRNLLATSRLVVLHGVGGIGKTRLSLQAAAELLDRFADGVWFVELAPIADANLVQQAVASALGVKEEPGHTLGEALSRHVKDRRLLLILDNCEHLVQACAALSKLLLQSGQHIRILASSREPLHLPGEQTYSLPVLRIPDGAARLTPEALNQYESARLFVERASAAQRTFEPTPQNADAIAEICRRLDGIPLAIELAAVRVRAMPVEEIVSRLTDRFRLLSRGDRTALPRQQTLRALIDWSHDLLTGDERTVFRRAAVFAGGWSVEAADAVTADGGLRSDAVVDLLTSLVEKSLVVLEPKGMRYRLLETVREYAQEKLRDASEEASVRTRHLIFFLTLAEKARPELIGPKQAIWLGRLDLERENLFAAHAWCDRVEDGGPLGLRLAHSMLLYWVNRGLLGLGLNATVQALAREGARERRADRCRGLFNAGQLACWMGQYEEARRYLEESVEIARALGDDARVAVALQPLGAACLGQGDPNAARDYLQDALAMARKLGNKRELAAALNALAQLHRAEGELGAAEPLYEKALGLARELGDRETIAIALLNLAMVAIGRDAADRARAMLLEVLSIVEETGSKPVEQSLLEVSAGLAALSDEWDHAARFYGAAESQSALTGLQREPADEAFLRLYVARARSALGDAKFAATEVLGRALSNDAALNEARAWLKGRADRVSTVR